MKQSRKSIKRKMYALIREWEAGSISQGAFCDQRGMSHSKFKYWRQKYRGHQGSGKAVKAEVTDSAAPATGSFVPVEVAAQVSGVDAYQLHFPNGVELRLPPGTAHTVLSDLIRLF